MKKLLSLTMALLAAGAAIAQPEGATVLDSSPQSIRVAPVPDYQVPGPGPRPQPDRNLSVNIWTNRSEVRVGEDITINYRASRDAYVLIFSTDADGVTRQLLPNPWDRDNFVRGGRSYSIPNRGYRLEVTPPKGRETLSIVAFREKSRAMDYYSPRSSNDPFPKMSGGARAAIQRIEPRPDGKGSRYAEDSTSIRVYGRNENGGPGHGGNYGDARLSVESNPSAAYVYINNQYMGITPLDLRSVRSGRYDVVINRAGYQPVRKRVYVSEGERVRVDERLYPIRN